MNKKWLLAAAIMGSTGVALGAMAGHYLKIKFELGLITEQSLHTFDTATKYQLFHALALMALASIDNKPHNKWLSYAGNLFMAGILFFSGSLYFLSTLSLSGMEFLKFLGPITPIGGIMLMLAWIFLGVAAYKQDK
jgi:uncharacterized membrane protein YgdD (TMEM256/DUF423 family)